MLLINYLIGCRTDQRAKLMVSMRVLYLLKKTIFVGRFNINNYWKVHFQVNRNMKTETNNYRTHNGEIMYKISKVKRRCRYFVDGL
jgi:hypothetical protein